MAEELVYYDNLSANAEFLQNIQSAVDSTGVVGRVEEIQTENGPITVIFMDEGADTNAVLNFTDVTQSGLENESSTLQYEIVDSEVGTESVQQNEVEMAEQIIPSEEIVTSTILPEFETSVTNVEVEPEFTALPLNIGQAYKTFDERQTSEPYDTGQDQGIAVPNGGTYVNTLANHTDMLTAVDVASAEVNSDKLITTTFNQYSVPISPQIIKIKKPTNERKSVSNQVFSPRQGVNLSEQYLRNENLITKVSKRIDTRNQLNATQQILTSGFLDAPNTRLSEELQAVQSIVDNESKVSLLDNEMNSGTVSYKSQSLLVTREKPFSSLEGKLLDSTTVRPSMFRPIQTKAQVPKLEKVKTVQPVYRPAVNPVPSSAISIVRPPVKKGRVIHSTSGTQTVIHVSTPAPVQKIPTGQQSTSLAKNQQHIVSKVPKRYSHHTPSLTSNREQAVTTVMKDHVIVHRKSDGVPVKATTKISSSQDHGAAVTLVDSYGQLVTKSVHETVVSKGPVPIPVTNQVVPAKSVRYTHQTNPVAYKQSNMSKPIMTKPVKASPLRTEAQQTRIVRTGPHLTVVRTEPHTSHLVRTEPQVTVLRTEPQTSPLVRTEPQVTVVRTEPRVSHLVRTESELTHSVVTEPQISHLGMTEGQGYPVNTETQLSLSQSTDHCLLQQPLMTVPPAAASVQPEPATLQPFATSTAEMSGAGSVELESVEPPSIPGTELQTPGTALQTPELSTPGPELPTPGTELPTPSSQETQAADTGNLQTIEVPDSDVTIQIFGDGTLVTSDKAGTKYSKINLDSLGLDKQMLQGDTNIELVIVQADGKEVKASIQTNLQALQNTIHNSQEEADTPLPNTDLCLLPTDATVESQVNCDYKANDLAKISRPYKCSKCPRTFKFEKTYKSHERVHEQAVVFSCSICLRAFAKAENLNSHMDLHKKIESTSSSKTVPKRIGGQEIVEYKCKDCGKIFISPVNFSRHIQQMLHNFGWISCPKCGKEFSSDNCFQSHMKKHIGPFLCPCCRQIFKNHEDLVSHTMNDHPGEVALCTVCDEIFQSKALLSLHLKAHQEEGDKMRTPHPNMHKCMECGKTFAKQHALKNHMITHSGDRAFQCTYCPLKFGSKWTMTKHIVYVHNNNGNHCEKCGIKFKRRDFYEAHNEQYHKGPYKCEKCGEIYQEKRELKSHEFTVHGMGVTCPICCAKFERKIDLMKHKDREHRKPANVLCDICGAGFVHKAHLKTHLVKEHFEGNKEKMLNAYPNMRSSAEPCEICKNVLHTKAASKVHYLNVHYNGNQQAMYKAHPHLKTYPNVTEVLECDHCGKLFSKMANLQAHLKYHGINRSLQKQKSLPKQESSNEEEDEETIDSHPRDAVKKYRCHIAKCKYRFARKATLLKHLNTHQVDYSLLAIRQLEHDERERAKEEERVGVQLSPKMKAKSEVGSPKKKAKPEDVSPKKKAKPEDVSPTERAKPEAGPKKKAKPEAGSKKKAKQEVGSRKKAKPEVGGKTTSIESPKPNLKKADSAKHQRDRPHKIGVVGSDTPARGRPHKIGVVASDKPAKKEQSKINFKKEPDQHGQTVHHKRGRPRKIIKSEPPKVEKRSRGRPSKVKKSEIEKEKIQSPKQQLKKNESEKEKIENTKQGSRPRKNPEHETDRLKQKGDAKTDETSHQGRRGRPAKKIVAVTDKSLHHGRRGRPAKKIVPVTDKSSHHGRRGRSAKVEAVKDKTLNQGQRDRPLNLKRKREEDTGSAVVSKRAKLAAKKKNANIQFKCKLCQRSFKKASSLIQHIQAKHKEQKKSGKPKKSKITENNKTSMKDASPVPVDNKEMDIETFLGNHLGLGKKQASVKEEEPQMNQSQENEVCDQIPIKAVDSSEHIDSNELIDNKEREDVISMRNSWLEGYQVAKYPCRECGNMYGTSLGLITHSKTKHTGLDIETVKAEIAEIDKATVRTTGQVLNTYSPDVLGSKSNTNLDESKIKQVEKEDVIKFHCKICFLEYSSSDELNKHLDIFHPIIQDRKETVTSTNTPTHIKDESIKEEFSCTVCSKGFAEEINLSRHVKMKHKIGKNCSTTNTPAHVKDRSRNEIKELSCTVCCKGFTEEINLSRHMKMKHKIGKNCSKNKDESAAKGQQQELECSHCSRTFKLQKNLTLHMKTKHGKKIKVIKTSEAKGARISKAYKQGSFKCKQCSKTFIKKIQLNVHVVRKHKHKQNLKVKLSKQGVKKQCDRCKESFTSMQSYRIHLRQKHIREMLTLSFKQSPKSTKTETSKTILDKKKKNLDSAVDSSSGFSKLKPKIESASFNRPEIKQQAEKVKASQNKESTPVCKSGEKITKHSKQKMKETMSSDTSVGNNCVACCYCKDCKRVFWSNQKYKLHMEKLHPDTFALELDKLVMEQLSQAEVGTKKYGVTAVELLSPKSRNSSTGIMKHTCKFCNRVNWTKRSFNEHMLKNHTEEVEKNPEVYGLSPRPEQVEDRNDKAPKRWSNSLSVKFDKGALVNFDQLAAAPVVLLDQLPLEKLIRAAEDANYESDSENKSEDDTSFNDGMVDCDDINGKKMEPLNLFVDGAEVNQNNLSCHTEPVRHECIFEAELKADKSESASEEPGSHEEDMSSIKMQVDESEASEDQLEEDLSSIKMQVGESEGTSEDQLEEDMSSSIMQVCESEASEDQLEVKSDSVSEERNFSTRNVSTEPEMKDDMNRSDMEVLDISIVKSAIDRERIHDSPATGSCDIFEDQTLKMGTHEVKHSRQLHEGISKEVSDTDINNESQSMVYQEEGGTNVFSNTDISELHDGERDDEESSAVLNQSPGAVCERNDESNVALNQSLEAGCERNESNTDLNQSSVAVCERNDESNADLNQSPEASCERNESNADLNQSPVTVCERNDESNADMNQSPVTVHERNNESNADLNQSPVTVREINDESSADSNQSPGTLCKRDNDESSAVLNQSPETDCERYNGESSAVLNQSAEIVCERDNGESSTVLNQSPEIVCEKDNGESSAVLNQSPEIVCEKDNGESSAVLNQSPETVCDRDNGEISAVLNQSPEIVCEKDNGESSAVLNQSPETVCDRDGGESSGVLNQSPSTVCEKDNGESSAVLNQSPETVCDRDGGESSAVLNQSPETVCDRDNGESSAVLNQSVSNIDRGEQKDYESITQALTSEEEYEQKSESMSQFITNEEVNENRTTVKQAFVVSERDERRDSYMTTTSSSESYDGSGAFMNQLASNWHEEKPTDIDQSINDSDCEKECAIMRQLSPSEDIEKEVKTMDQSLSSSEKDEVELVPLKDTDDFLHSEQELSE